MSCSRNFGETHRRRLPLLALAAILPFCTMGNVGCDLVFPLTEPAPSANNALEAHITATGKVQGADVELRKDFRVCMPDDLNPNKNGGVEPTFADLTDYCTDVLVPIARKMLEDCAAEELKNFVYVCEVVNARFLDAACEETCILEVLNDDCSNLETATVVSGIAETACLAEQNPEGDGPRPMGAALAKRSTAEATEALGSTITIVRGGDDQTKPAEGRVELNGDLSPGSAISVSSVVTHVGDFSFDAFGGLASATLTNVFASNSSTATAILAVSGEAVFGPSTTVSTGGGKLEKPLAFDETGRFAVENADNVVAAVDLLNHLCTLDSTAVGDDDGTTVEVITHLVANLVNQPPQANAGADANVECTSAAGATVLLDCSGSADPDGNILAHQWRVGSRTGDELGIFDVSVGTDQALDAVEEYFCNVVDGFGQISSDSIQILVTDTTAPVISCNAPPSILPTDAPISFTATAEDTCDPDAGGTVAIVGFDCFLVHKDKRIDKTESCAVVVDGATITILDVGGVGTHITWTVTATDDHDNTAVEECEVVVEKPGI